MEEELDPFDYDLADAIGCTVAEMRERVSNQEYLQRLALRNVRQARRQLEQQPAVVR